MGNLICMDLYRMRKSKSFYICLILAFVIALSLTPLEKLFYLLTRLIVPDDPIPFPPAANLSDMIRGCLNPLITMLAMLSAVGFFYADMESGYIKNIAGQMPRRGFSILSRYLAVIPHNALFMLTGLIGNIIGTVFFRRIVFDAEIVPAIGTFLLKLLLLQSICAILLLTAASFRNKSLASVLAVLMGLSLMSLIYMGIDTGLSTLLKNPDFSISPYMPDELLGETVPDTMRALAVSTVTIAVFLTLSIRVFDIKDVK